MFASKSGDGAISGMPPGSSHTDGSSWMRALPVVYTPCWSAASLP
jgi:hypothetical protein